MPYMPDLDAVLTAGYSVERDGTMYVVEPFDLGPVVLPTGEIVACDPLVPHTTAFAETVAPGRYPLRAWWRCCTRTARNGSGGSPPYSS
jgi:hypothetical protein